VTAFRWQLPFRNRAGSAQVVRLTADLWKRINGVPPGEARPRSSPRGGRMGAGRHSHRDGDTAAGRPAPRSGRALRRMECVLLLAHSGELQFVAVLLRCGTRLVANEQPILAPPR
jgi:hypothetical protein